MNLSEMQSDQILENSKTLSKNKGKTMESKFNKKIELKNSDKIEDVEEIDP